MLVTSGPTQEPIDPVRYIANRWSGKQGHAIAAAAAAAGADVTLISGPVNVPIRPVSYDQGNHRARDAGCRHSGAARRRRGVRRRGCRLAGGSCQRQQDQETERRRAATRPRRKSRHPRNGGATKSERPRPVIGFAAETTSCSRTRRRSSNAKGAIGSSPTTYPPTRASWAAIATPSTFSPRRASSTGHRNRNPTSLASGYENRERAGAGSEMKIELRIMRLPHAEGLPLPTYQSELAAGPRPDRRGAVGCAYCAGARCAPRSRPGFALRCRPVRKARSGHDPGWRCDTVSPY